MLPHFFCCVCKIKKGNEPFLKSNFHWHKRFIRPWCCSVKCLYSDDCFAEMLKISSRFLASSIVLPVDAPRDTCSKTDWPAVLYCVFIVSPSKGLRVKTANRGMLSEKKSDIQWFLYIKRGVTLPSVSIECSSSKNQPPAIKSWAQLVGIFAEPPRCLCRTKLK